MTNILKLLGISKIVESPLERRRRLAREYYRKNHERMLAWGRAYRDKNSEWIKAKQRDYYARRKVIAQGGSLCKAKGCTRESDHRYKGYCHACYQFVWRGGNPEKPRSSNRADTNRTELVGNSYRRDGSYIPGYLRPCGISYCKSNQKVKGLCRRHYELVTTVIREREIQEWIDKLKREGNKL